MLFRAGWQEELVISRDVGDRRGFALALGSLGEEWALRGEPEQAARLLGAEEALREGIDVVLQPHQRKFLPRRLAIIRAQGLRAGIEQTNAFRATHGEPPLRAELVWFDSAEAEAGFQQALNWMRAVPGQWSISVTDLRARAAVGTVAGSYGDGIVRQLDAPTAERLGVPVAP